MMVKRCRKSGSGSVSLCFLVAATALVACTRAQPGAGQSTGEEPDRPTAALELELEVARITAKNAGGGKLWPGFDPLAVPLAVYDGEQTFLFRHPAPPRGFMPASNGDSGPYVRDGRHEAMVANTVVEMGGVRTATVLLDQFAPDSTLTDRAAVAIHEAFHAWQRAHHPDWIANEADLFTYPTDSVELLALRRQETEAVRKGLATDAAVDGACWTRLALALRGDRYALLDPVFAAYEHGTELNEGLAFYIQARAAGRRTVELPASGFEPTDVRRRASETGAAIALLLDRFMPDWKVKLAARRKPTLAEVLSAAVGPGDTCALDHEVVAEAEKGARADISALLDDRARRIAAFERRSGWRVVVEVVPGSPLMPRGYDPVNIEPLDAERILHTRFLRLGNSAGELEVLNTSAMTEAAGSHPILQGVRRVILTGLAKPRVTQAEGHVSVTTPGLTLEFDGATVVRADETITVKLGS